MDNHFVNSLLTINMSNLMTFFFTLAIDVIVLLIVIHYIYKKYNSNREFLFTFGIFNVIIFIICFLLSNATLSIGFSFGLFAIFSILRYRTIPIPIKDMTYFFLAISIAIINALSSTVIGFPELLVANIAVVTTTYLFEKTWRKTESVKYIKYEKIELIKPENRDKLLKDLTERTGLQILRVEIGKLDFLRDVAEVRVFYKSNDGHFENINIESDDDDD